MGFTAFLMISIVTTPMGQDLIAKQVNLSLDQSGVKSRTTAVLLNFRGYDTLLEVVVLLLAVIGIWSLTRAPFPKRTLAVSPVQLSLQRLLAPLMCLAAAYLVWQGSHAAGGAFQGGAVLGGAGVLMLVTDTPSLRSTPSLLLRIALLAGPVFFVTVALWCLKAGNLLQYPQGYAGSILLAIETSCAFSIGVTITALFAGGRPRDSQVS